MPFKFIVPWCVRPVTDSHTVRCSIDI